jgi:hypothetical protein
MTTFGIEWAAGFFEGEGTAYVREHNKINKIYPCLSLAIAQVYREPLDEFQRIVGYGKVRGPYGPYSGNRQPHYQYAVSGSDAVTVAELLIPFLFRKGEQVQDALEVYQEYLND